jgi:type IVB pilus formation R64 PilN family outer membrane protein
MIRMKTPFIAALLAASCLTGCASFKASSALDKQVQDQINNLPSPDQQPVVSTVNEPYLAGTMVNMEDQTPEIMRDTKVTMVSSQPMTLQDIASRLSETTNIPVIDEVDVGSDGGAAMPAMPGMQSGASFGGGSSGGGAQPISYIGSVAGFMNYLQEKFGAWSKFENGQIVLFHDEAKTYTLSMTDMPLTEKTQIIASAGGALGDTNLGGGQSNNSSGQSDGSTTISTQTGADLWADVDKTVTTLAGPGSTVSVDPAMNAVTVFGTPPQILRVSEWVQQINQTIGQQVQISVHVYSVALNNEQNYGFNPAVAFNQATKQFGFSMSGPSVPTVQTAGTNPLTISGFLGTGSNPALSQFSGTSAAVQALATLGNVTETFEQNVVTMDDQPVPIQVAQNTGYLAESESTATADVGTEDSLIPGNITTGFTGLFTPSIVDGRILLTMNVTLSALISLTTETSAGSSIQVPTSSNSEFSQSVALRPGQTLLLTGYKQRQDQTTNNGVGSPFFDLLGGGADASNKNQVIAITVTARILGQ